jgi:deoxyribonuclease-2
MLYLFLFLSTTFISNFGPTFSQREPRFPLNPSFNLPKKVESNFGPTFSQREPRFPLNPSFNLPKKVESNFGPTFSQKVVFGPTFSQKVECLNENGNPVDYWVAIKLPKSTNYFYYDSDSRDFHTSPHSLNDTSVGALTHTTKQLWQTDVNYAIYNDQPPKVAYDADAGKFGHTKGFFAFAPTADNGFWLTHSIPLFPVGPNESDNYLGLGSNAGIYAQHLLCLSVTTPVINDLAQHFLLNRPQLYTTHLTTEKYDYIRQLIDGKYSTLNICDTSVLLTSGGHPFKLYAKTAQWNNDLYAGCVTPTEKDTLWVESWIRGSAEGPTCPVSDYDTLDIKTLEFVVGDRIYSWQETHDHSKWAITANRDVICMGDINRMTTQYSRGGGTACFSDKILHSILKKATTKTNECLQK